ncbi:class I SAM-dependent methyltransferase [Bacteriovoracaceae bacterium]|nr:class I SAM-dependent methyltransferase [Bacteriovoracaceae bacterium]
MKFEKEYWDANYAEPDTMDGIGNAKEHVKYMKALFELDLIDISSVVDFGFGYGHLFKRVLKEFIPYRACGIEMSKYAFDKVKKKKLKPVESTNLFLYNESVQDWCLRKDSARLHFDLGICTSVFQYINDDEIDDVIRVMSERVKYLYLSVPTDIELNRQISELEFHDKYALRRSRDFYQKAFSKNFSFISNRVLESKHYFNEEDTHFSDLLFRF